MKIVGLILVAATALLLLYAVSDFPDWADPESPASTHVSPHYITKTIEETSVPNIVTSVLADYRGYDTMFETAVVFTAGIVVYAILRRTRRRKMPELGVRSADDSTYTNLIVKTICRLMVPFMQLYALYVIAHGHHSPGGGFQGGVILGASFILLAISYDLTMVLKRMREKTNIILASVGILIYSGIGVICSGLGGNFLDYSRLSAVLPATDAIEARSHGMLGIEIGVAITVMAVMISIFSNLVSSGRYDERF